MKEDDFTSILGIRISNSNYSQVTTDVISWAEERISRRVHATNVHMIMEAYDDPFFREVVKSADINTADGMPLVWAAKLLGNAKAERVYGPTLTLHICERAARERIPIGLYGGTPESLHDFKSFLQYKYPNIRVVCAIAPPFRPLTQEEDEIYSAEIIESGACILFVGIGCPKQEWWMYEHRHRLPLVMLGVGAAFDFHSGRVRQAPVLLQHMGMEWLFRLIMEPRRLWRRYARHNPRFITLFAQQLLRHHLSKGARL